MNCLVTGGAGFIGSHVVERLTRDGVSVTVIDDFNDYYDPAIKRANVSVFSPSVKVVEGDLLDDATLDAAFGAGAFDRIIHLAARAGVRPSLEQPELYFDVNIRGTYRLLEAARLHRVPHFVFASSSSVYGVNPNSPFREVDALTRTISPYAMTKLAGEHLCSQYSYIYGMRAVCLRFFTVYGPRQRPDLAISKFTRLIDKGEAVPRYGDGSTRRDYTFVDDIIEGVMGALRYEKSDFSIFNLGGGQSVALQALIEMIAESLGKRAEIREVPMQDGDVPLTSADVSQALAELGFAPKTAIREGIQKYVAWFRGVEQRGVGG